MARIQVLPRQSALFRLSPFLDQRGILCVDGKIKHALFAYDEKHPVIPCGSKRVINERCMLYWAFSSLDLLRQRFWISRGRATVKPVIHQCLHCLAIANAATDGRPSSPSTHTIETLSSHGSGLRGADYAEDHEETKSQKLQSLHCRICMPEYQSRVLKCRIRLHG